MATKAREIQFNYTDPRKEDLVVVVVVGPESVVVMVVSVPAAGVLVGLHGGGSSLEGYGELAAM